SLKQFRFTSNINAVGRAYGGSTDTAANIGRSGKGEITFDALIGISATSKTDVHDVYNVAGAVATERRWRVKCSGSGSNAFTVDFRCRFRSVNVGEHEGERLYAVNGVWVYDSTLGGRGQFTIANSVATIP
ncbi:MAG TPA: hypothetical protein VIU37_02170, partial [Candidatus Limnocylindrales bacterium]